MRTLKPFISMISGFWTCPWSPKPFISISGDTMTLQITQENAKAFFKILVWGKIEIWTFWKCWKCVSHTFKQSGCLERWKFVFLKLCTRQLFKFFFLWLVWTRNNLFRTGTFCFFAHNALRAIRTLLQLAFAISSQTPHLHGACNSQKRRRKSQWQLADVAVRSCHTRNFAPLFFLFMMLPSPRRSARFFCGAGF